MSFSSLMKPSLEVVQASKTQQICEIKGADFHIGRLSNLDLFIDDIRVSRPHARIQQLPDGSYELVDLDSQNGTHVAGRRLAPYRPVRLRDGDRIKIVEYELIFHQPGPVVHEPHDDRTTVLGSLNDLSSDHLARRSKHPAETLKAILDVVRALGEGANLGEVLSRALDGLMKVFPQAERGFIVMAEHDGSFPLAAYRRRQGHTSAPTLSRTIRDRVLREGEAVLIKDITKDKALGDEYSLVTSIRSAICVPLRSHDGKTIGMVQLDRIGGCDHFQEQDLELLATLTLPIAVVVVNDRLLKEQTSWAAAIEIQRALLPRARPQISGYTFWECYRPAHEVGGDLYDYIPVGEPGSSSSGQERWAVTLGDVAGKGMPAALVMAGICPEVRHLVRAGVPAVDVLSQVSRHIYDTGVAGRFVTLVITMIDSRANELTVATAGHPHALIRRAGGSVEEIDCDGTGPPLGVSRDATYRATQVPLQPGDVVVLFSDGVTDAMDQKNQSFGLNRLRSHLAEAPAGVAGVGESILAAVRDHFAGRSQFDDITIVCFGREPS
jgi:phosphoserine phosphatase RsbU/P